MPTDVSCHEDWFSLVKASDTSFLSGDVPKRMSWTLGTPLSAMWSELIFYSTTSYLPFQLFQHLSPDQISWHCERSQLSLEVESSTACEILQPLKNRNKFKIWTNSMLATCLPTGLEDVQLFAVHRWCSTPAKKDLTLDPKLLLSLLVVTFISQLLMKEKDHNVQPSENQLHRHHKSSI